MNVFTHLYSRLPSVRSEKNYDCPDNFSSNNICDVIRTRFNPLFMNDFATKSLESKILPLKKAQISKVSVFWCVRMRNKFCPSFE